MCLLGLKSDPQHCFPMVLGPPLLLYFRVRVSNRCSCRELADIMAEETVVGEDRISELPVHIIHKILRRIHFSSGLKQEARTCVLSKKWNLIWRTRPDVILQYFHYKYRYFDKYRKLDDFVKLVDDSLRPHVEQNLRIEIFCLRHLDPEELPCHSHVDRWVELAIKLGVKFLEIEAARKYYSIPDSIYASKTLTGLYLSGFNFADDQLQRLMCTCSLIKDLKLSHCMGFKNLRASGLVNLEYLELARCKELRKIEIWAPNLKEFVYVGVPLKGYPRPELLPCTIDILDGHKTLEYLRLENTTVTDQQFEHQLSIFTALKVLEVDGYHVMKNIKVVGEKLKEFRLRRWWNLEQVNILAAPNLMTFYFQGLKMPVSITSIDLSNLEQGRLDVYLQPPSDHNFGDVHRIWKQVVRNLKYCNRSLKLVFHCEESILIYEVVLRELDLNPMMPLESFVNDMLFSQPKMISVVHGIDSKILEVFHEMTEKMQNTRLKEVTNHKGPSWLESNSLITTFNFKWE